MSSTGHASPPSNKVVHLGDDLKADAESLWKIIADAADTVLGVKDHPERLLKITNTVITCLIFSVVFLYVKLPPRSPNSPPIDWAAMHFSLWPRDVLTNSVIIAKSPQSISYMLGGFIALLLGLSFLVNAVGTAAIKAQAALKPAHKND